MALSFPSDPINGAVSGDYTYDATKGAWRKNAALPVSVTHSDVAPSNPREGDQWWKSDEGTLFTYYNDGTSSQWVESTNVVASSDPNPIPAGAMMAWASDVVPANWLLCDGSAVSRSTYASLFAAVGTTYGSGDGTTTFNLPNLKGKTIVGRDSGQTEFDTLGETGGAKTHTLTISEIPSHTHASTLSSNVVSSSDHRHDYKFSFFDNNYKATGPNAGMGGGLDTAGAWRYSTSRWQGGVSDGTSNQTTETAGGTTTGTSTRFSTTGDTNTPSASTTVGITNASAGSGGAHNNLQPYIVLNYIIKFSAGETPGDSQLAVRVGNLETQNNATPISSNYIINGALDYWQRGTSGTVAANGAAYVSADRYRVIAAGGSAPTVTFARSTDVPSGVGAQYSGSFSWSGTATSADLICGQYIENGKYLFAGKTVTISFYAKASTATVSGFNFDQDYGSTNFNITTSWARYSYTLTLPSTFATSRPVGTGPNDHIELRFLRMTNSAISSNTIYFTGLQVEEGSYATPFKRSAPSLQAELAACQRYYELVVPPSGVTGTGFANSGTQVYFTQPFKTSKRDVPTVSYVGTLSGIQALWSGGGLAATAFTSGARTTEGCYIVITVASGFTTGQAVMFTTSSAVRITAESEI
jgi:microcystin-dependent protein